MLKLTTQQKLQIAAEAMADPRTISRIYTGKPTLKMVRERIITAAKKLGLPLPPPTSNTKKGHSNG